MFHYLQKHLAKKWKYISTNAQSSDDNNLLNERTAPKNNPFYKGNEFQNPADREKYNKNFILNLIYQGKIFIIYTLSLVAFFLAYFYVVYVSAIGVEPLLFIDFISNGIYNDIFAIPKMAFSFSVLFTSLCAMWLFALICKKSINSLLSKYFSFRKIDPKTFSGDFFSEIIILFTLAFIFVLFTFLISSLICLFIDKNNLFVNPFSIHNQILIYSILPLFISGIVTLFMYFRFSSSEHFYHEDIFDGIYKHNIKVVFLALLFILVIAGFIESNLRLSGYKTIISDNYDNVASVGSAISIGQYGQYIFIVKEQTNQIYKCDFKNNSPEKCIKYKHNDYGL